jgi:hypothetical protein
LGEFGIFFADFGFLDGDLAYLLAEAFAIVFDVGIYGEGFQFRVGKHPVFECEGSEIDDMRGYCHIFPVGC